MTSCLSWVDDAGRRVTGASVLASDLDKRAGVSAANPAKRLLPRRWEEPRRNYFTDERRCLSLSLSLSFFTSFTSFYLFLFFFSVAISFRFDLGLSSICRSLIGHV